MGALVRPPSPEDLPQWRDLWLAYLAFYETDLPESSTGSLWERIIDPVSPIRCHVAEDAESLVGLVHYFPHDDTWSSAPICYLQDLYVEPSRRGEGIGATLIESVVAEARESQWSAVYWLTAEDNHQGRALYDRLTGGTTGFIHYQIEITPI